MVFHELVTDLIFIWMGVGAALLLIHYRAIKKSQEKE